jgi:site-specific DNA-methyltransferase (adenine-specific)
MKTLPDKSIDLFLCDLPYGCLGPQKKGGGVPRENTDGAFGGSNWDIPINLTEFWVQVERLMKDDHTPIIHFCNTRFGYELIKSKEDWFRYDLIYEKTLAVGFLLANKMPLRSHENMYIFAKKGARYNRIDIEGDFKKNGGSRHYKTDSTGLYGTILSTEAPNNEGRRCVKSVITIQNKKGKGQHPTQKPVELYQWLIERYSNEGDTVLDPTAGSFTSVFTAHKLNRNAIGIEKEDRFYQKALTNECVATSQVTIHSSSSDCS